MAEILHHPRCHPNIEIMGVAGGSIKGATMQYMAGGAGFQPSTVLRQTCSIVSVVVRLVIFRRNIAMHCHWHKICYKSASSMGMCSVFYTLLQFSCVFPVANSCVQFPAVAFQLQIPVANSSCKFYLHWGKHSQAQKLSKQILIRCQVSMIGEETAYMSLCS